MKKFFLMIAAGLIATSASAQKKVYSIDYATTDWNFYVMGYTPEKGDGCIVSNNPMEGEDGGPSWYQYFIADGVPTKVGESYTVVVNCKASEEVTVGMNMGWGWGDGEVLGNSISIPTDWADVEVDYKKPVGGESCNVVLQPGTTTATIYIKSVTVYQNPPAAQYETEDVETVKYADYATYPYDDLGAVPVINDGILSFTPVPDPEDPENDSNQFYAMYGVKLQADTFYGIKTKVKGSKAGTVKVALGSWGETVDADLDLSEDWVEVQLPLGDVKLSDDPEEEYFVLVTAEGYDGTIEMEYCTLAIFTEIPPVVIPTEWVSVVGNCNANDGESKNLVDRNPSIDNGGLQYNDEYSQEHDAYAFICDNPAGEGKVYYCPINADPTEAWDSQFFIVFDEPLEAETPIKVSFDYYCSDERSIDTQAHGLPGQYQHWAFVGTLNAKPEWQNLFYEGEISGNQAGANGCSSIAFNLSSKPEAATFYINNVSVQVEKEVTGEDAVKTVNAIIVPAKGVYTMQGVKVANTLEEVTEPGMYIFGGKKYIKK